MARICLIRTRVSWSHVHIYLYISLSLYIYITTLSCFLTCLIESSDKWIAYQKPVKYSPSAQEVFPQFWGFPHKSLHLFFYLLSYLSQTNFSMIAPLFPSYSFKFSHTSNFDFLCLNITLWIFKYTVMNYH